MRFPAIDTILFLLATLGFAQQPSEIKGDYLEARSNHVYGCYCEWSGEAITSGREAILAWDFKAGEFRGIDLAGVRVAAVIFGQATLSTGVAPRVSVLFFDSSVSKEQQQAARSLLSGQYGRLLGQILKLHVVPILFYQDVDNAHLNAGEHVTVVMRKARLPEDAMLGAKLWYDPFILLMESTLATTLNNRYQGTDVDRRWDTTDPAVTGYYGHFSVMSR